MSDTVHIQLSQTVGGEIFEADIPIREVGRMFEKILGDKSHEDSVDWEEVLQIELAKVAGFDATKDEWNQVNWSLPDFRIDQSAPNWITLLLTGSGEGCLFFHNDYNSNLPYRYIEPGERFKISGSGTITYECAAEGIYHVVKPEWDKYQRPADWPDILLNPNPWIALAKMEDILTPYEENPLTILLSIGSPARGNAMQLVARLKNIRELLMRSLNIEDQS